MLFFCHLWYTLYALLPLLCVCVILDVRHPRVISVRFVRGSHTLFLSTHHTYIASGTCAYEKEAIGTLVFVFDNVVQDTLRSAIYPTVHVVVTAQHLATRLRNH